MSHILIIEDDLALCKGIELTLKDTVQDFILCHSLQSARQALGNGTFDLIILDINLPDGSGLDFCREIRGSVSAPILFLTANDTEMDIVIGLESGGDDYITKPFSLAVLRARVNVLLRRGAVAPQSAVVIDGFHFDFSEMRFSKNAEPVELSKTEQRLLRLLVSNKGQTLTRDMLLEHVWTDGSEYVDENALSVAVSRLRTKLENEPGAPRYIKTVYGIGYTWAVNL